MYPRLNRKIVLEGRVRTPDGAGGFSDVWTPLGTLWAELKAGTGREAGEDFATLSRSGYRVIVRAAPYGASSRPKADQRFTIGDRVFTILAVAEADFDGRYLSCTTVEEVVT